MTYAQLREVEAKISEKAEKEAYKLVQVVLLGQYKKVYKSLLISTASASKIINAISRKDFESMYFKIYSETGVKVSKEQYNRLLGLKRVSPDFFSKIWQQFILSALGNLEIVQRITKVSNTTKELYRSLLQTAANERMSPVEINKLFRQNIANLTKQRALTIARTEMTHAASLAKDFASSQIEFQTYKLWNHYQHGNYRETHLAINKKYVKSESTFTVNGKQMKYPGDPSGGASECINCRCNHSVVSENVLKELGIWK